MHFPQIKKKISGICISAENHFQYKYAYIPKDERKCRRKKEKEKYIYMNPTS